MALDRMRRKRMARARAKARRVETVLVTGASSGIGEALSRRFAREGHALVLVARTAARLEALASELAAEYGATVWVQPTDLSQPGAARALARTLRRRRVEVNLLVNNAGILEQGEFAAMTAARHQALIDLNVTALTSMVAEFLPAMLERGSGRILNVASIAAFQPVPLLATYAATKAFVLSLSESLAEELKETGVTVTALCPGITATDMLTTATAANSNLASLPAFLVGNASAVADEAYRACMQGQPICVPGAVNEALTLAARATPKWLLRRIAGHLARRIS
jgi:uncharacterized protein